jgi:hypothetical protein
MDIKKILDEHNLWFETGGKEGARANLRGADLIPILKRLADK